jgi:UDP-N-acetyl-2-amino-2-deoxyglucuronate dehydrogenase
MKYALIGCGRIARNHITAALANHLDIVGLCDVVDERPHQLIREFNLDPHTPTYRDYVTMIKAEKPDLVAICTESGKHGPIGLACLDLGVHLIIEKPITLSLAEADQLIQKSQATGLKVAACHQNRFNKSIQAIKTAIDAGKFGKLSHGTAHVRWNRGKDYYTQAPWRGTWEQDGGALMNQCIHNIDLLRWLMGNDVAEVYGVTKRQFHDYLEVEDLGTALVRFKNGSVGIIEGTTNVYPTNLEETLYLFGEHGTAKAGGKSVNLLEEFKFADFGDDLDAFKADHSEMPPNVYGFGHTRVYDDMIAAITDHREPYVTAQDGRNALELVLAIYLSSALNQPVRLPLTNLSTQNFLGVFTGRIE